MRSVREEINNVEAIKSIAMMRWSWMVVRLPAAATLRRRRWRGTILPPQIHNGGMN